MVYTGHWADAQLVTKDGLNSTLLQYDVVANRPAAGNLGVMFWATDENILYRDNGTTWDAVINKDQAAGTASLRTLGSSSTQASAGNHTHGVTEVEAQSNTQQGGNSATVGMINSTIGGSFADALADSITVDDNINDVYVIAACSFNRKSGSSTDTAQMEVRRVTTQLATLTITITGTAPQGDQGLLAHLDAAPGSGSQSYDVRSRQSAGANDIDLIAQAIRLLEVQAA